MILTPQQMTESVLKTLDDVVAENFPPEEREEATGGFARDITLRDHIAIEAMKAMLGPFLMKELDEVDPDGWMDGVSMDAYNMADAMLKAKDM